MVRNYKHIYISDRIAKVHAQLDMWDSRLSSLPVDRAMVAKTRVLFPGLC